MVTNFFNLREIKNFFKQSLIKEVSLDQDFPSLQKDNVINKEYLDIPKAETLNFRKSSQKFLIKNNYKIFTSAYTTVLKNVLYSPQYNLILSQNKGVILESFSGDRKVNSFNLKSIFNPNVENIKGYCIVFEQVENNYYHTLIDNIPRFVLSCEHPIIQNQENEIKLLSSNSLFSDAKKYRKFYLEKLTPNNLKETILEKNKLYKVENLIISTFLCHDKTPGFLPKSYREKIFNQFLPQRKRTKKNRIYISREKAYNGRNIINENDFVSKIEKYGFKKYILEKLTMVEQIDLFYDAEIIIAPHGAGLTNLLFSENIKIIELFTNANTQPHYYYLAKSMGHIYYHWCGESKHRGDSFVVNIDQITDILENCI